MKIIFLDIDGVMKPARAYLDKRLSSDRDGGFDPVAVGAINRLCALVDAQVVFNTTWNQFRAMYYIGTSQGLSYIHPTFWRTDYPELTLSGGSRVSKGSAIRQWLAKYGADVSHWVALDDQFIHTENGIDLEPNAILIDSMFGITIDDFNSAAKILGHEGSPFLVLV